MKHLIYIISFAILTVVALSAEGSRETTPQNISIEDTTGNIAYFSELPNRITFAGKSANLVADVLYMFPEATKRIVGTGTTNQRNGDFIEMLDPNYKDKIYLERNVGPEQIAATNPELVVMKNFLKKSLGEPLAQLDIPVLYLNLETPEFYEKDLRILGKVFGNQARALELINYYKQNQERITNKTKDLKETPEVLFLYHTTRDGVTAFNIPPENWIQTRMVRMAGGSPVWADTHPGGGWSKINFEQIAAWNPDQIYIVAYKENINKVMESIKESQEWQELDAFKNGQLKSFPVDYYSWDQPDSRWILGLNWLAKEIHPELFSDLDIKAITKNFYTELYFLTEDQYNKEIISRLGW